MTYSLWRSGCAAGLLLACLGGTAWCAPMQCGAAATPVEKAICASPALVQADRQMAASFATRLEQCPASERGRLRQTQKFWLRDRDDCANALSETDGGAVARCVAGRMKERLAQLDRIGAACNLDAVAAEYRYVDPDYLEANGRAYVGKVVSVRGSLTLTRCDADSSDLTARLGPMEPAPGTTGLPVHFKALSALQREWLCVNRPASSFKGTVRQEHGVIYLYLTDILGEPV